MQVYVDFVTGTEFFSDAKEVIPVLNDKGEPTGLVKVKAEKQTAGGGKVDVGSSYAEGAAPGEDDTDVEETKWDQFWAFPDIQVRSLDSWQRSGFN